MQEFSQSSQLGSNGDYIEMMYEAWLENPDNVPADWASYFKDLPGHGVDIPHSMLVKRIQIAQYQRDHNGSGAVVSDDHARRQAGVLRLLTAYRSRGHLVAKLDPLNLSPANNPPDLGLAFHGLSESDLDTEFDTGSFCGGNHGRMKLRDLWQHLKDTYTGTLASEFMHIADHEQRNWVYSRLEKAGGNPALSAAEQKHILQRLTAANGLERYLHTKYVGQKRFSLEGGDALIPLMDTMISGGGAEGVKEVVIGMAHRGRLNMLVNVLGKPPADLFDEFEGKYDHNGDAPDYSGDVKYHMGFSADVTTPSGNDVHLALAFNPSHLEIADPVVAGSVRARQTLHRLTDESRNEVLPILIHGDAAFAAQGVVMENFQMSQTRGFGVGGTIHIVINNQVGFTISDPRDARSTLYTTDVAKVVDAPIFHVNGDDPEAVVQAARLAFEFRHTFHRDVVIDLVCYRRNGHNEADEPAATQPLMYKIIRKHPTPAAVYAQRLQEQQIIDAEAVKQMTDTYRENLEKGQPIANLAATQNGGTKFQWDKHLGGSLNEEVKTAIDKDTLDRLCDIILTVPEDMTLHSRVQRIYDTRLKMAAGEQPMDWGFAENLAYAAVINDGYDMRLVGQDSGRGTFFHRHAVMHDQDTGRTEIPLAWIDKARNVEVIDSLLSEEAAMAFEYGYATADPSTLTIWEAQFGDFANGAQVVIDQFISAAESKWKRLCGLTLYLPHGYEGQGPEHSSARLERYLQLCALDNMQVCEPTTPAQAFHMIRRQMLREVRKPLIVMTPKSLLRHKLATSSLDELVNGKFYKVLPDTRIQKKSNVKRVILCSGKVYYDLYEQAEKDEVDNVALVRVEQLYPFPVDDVIAEFKKYSKLAEVVWCQEEPMNQGAWYQIRHHLKHCAGDLPLAYTGRPRSASPASGYARKHMQEQQALVHQALHDSIDNALVRE